MRTHVLFLALGALGFAVFGAACGDDDGSPAGGSNADLIAAINVIDGAGLHGFAESINDEDEIPAGARTAALKLQATMELVDWPDDLAGEAEALGETFGAMAAALDGEEPDMEAAGAAAAAAHDDAHDFSASLWEHLYEEAGVDPGEGGDHQ